VTPEYLIREASDDDGDALRGLLRREWAAYEGCLFEADEALLTRPASLFAERGGRLWLVTREGGMAGSLAIAGAARPGEFELSLLCLEQRARGQGIAAALLAGADAYARASGGFRLNVWIDERLVDGVAFLERQGFVRDPGVRRRGDGSEALDAHFSRVLDAEPS
jgi:putative acetyltransferase